MPPAPAQSTNTITEVTPIGWYPDNANTWLLRWWDGAAWTEHTTPVHPLPNPVDVETPEARRRRGWATGLAVAAMAIVAALLAADIATAAYELSQPDPEGWGGLAVGLAVVYAIPLLGLLGGSYALLRWSRRHSAGRKPRSRDWYQDPTDPTRQRYWTGQHWMNRTRLDPWSAGARGSNQRAWWAMSCAALAALITPIGLIDLGLAALVAAGILTGQAFFRSESRAPLAVAVGALAIVLMLFFRFSLHLGW